MLARRQLAYLLTLACLLPALGACVGTVEDGDKRDEGNFTVEYEQVPLTAYAGIHQAAGEALRPDGTIPAGALVSVGGGSSIAIQDTIETVAYAVTDNQDGTYDGLVLFLREVGELRPGVRQIDGQNLTAAFVFVDDAENFDLPDTLTATSMRDWLLAVPAAYNLLSAGGTIDITRADADTLTATFAGTAVDANDSRFVVDFTNGALTLVSDNASAVATPTALLTSLITSPNPFNPRTTLNFSLAEGQRVRVEVVDIAGRRVNVLHEGTLDARPHRISWSGTDMAGRSVPAGVYLLQVVGEGWRQAVKVSLLP